MKKISPFNFTTIQVHCSYTLLATYYYNFIELLLILGFEHMYL